MKNTEYLGFKAKPMHRQRVDRIAMQTGLSRSGVLRALVENATIRTKSVFEPFSTLNEKSGNTLSDQEIPGEAAQVSNA